MNAWLLDAISGRASFAQRGAGSVPPGGSAVSGSPAYGRGSGPARRRSRYGCSVLPSLSRSGGTRGRPGSPTLAVRTCGATWSGE